jgi:uncharacterized protein (TIGR02246 family)
LADADLAARLRRLEDREAIRVLVARYAQTCDERDIDGLADLFTEDATMRSQDGVMDARGRAAIVEMYHGRFAVLGPSFHYSHDQVVTFDEGDPDVASGLVTSHAEVWRNGAALLAAMRYEDRYRREGAAWRFASRLLRFFYYVPVTEYAGVLGDRFRMRAYAQPQSADWPEGTATWERYHAR